MDTRAQDLTTKRLRIFARVCFAWGLLILARLFQLQILDHETYERLAQQQQERQVEVQAPRGAIFDRNGQALAMSVAVESVCINPSKISDSGVAAHLLSGVLGLDRAELKAKIDQAGRRGFLWVKRKVSPEEAARLRSLGVQWIEFRNESSRYYPKNILAAHILGGVDHEEKGNGGIELALDKDLRGKPGIMRTIADVKQNVFDLQVFSDPQPGASVTLTIDERIQYVAEKELATAVKEHGASTGSLVVMNPNTGDIYAIANYPTYNPNEAPESKEAFEARKNLAVTAPFEPGSVFKVITIAAALDTTDLRPHHTFHCGNGAFTLFRRVIHDAKPHAVLSVSDILAKSSNIGAIKIGMRVGNQTMYDYIRAFGFGSTTGLPLPGESGGMLRKPSRWIASSIGSIAMGHELSTTTVQLAQACSVVANGGLLVKPRLVIRKQRPGQDPVAEPAAQTKRVISDEHANDMRIMMRGVVDHGTGKLAQLPGYSAGGKTGSAQIYDYAARVYTHRYNGSFMGFAPANKPQITVVVTLNNTPSGSRGFGGVVAAPVFKKVAAAALRYLNVPKDLAETETTDPSQVLPEPDLADAEGGEPPELEAPPQQTEVPVLLAAAATTEIATGPKVPDFTGKTKRAVIAESAAKGVRVEVAGSGIARGQYPLPGSILRPGERVRVQFAR